MLGREINGPLDLNFQGPDPDETSSYEQSVIDLGKNIKAAHEFAHEKLKSSQAIAKRDYDFKTLHDHILLVTLCTF